MRWTYRRQRNISFPAYDDLAADIELGFSAWRVYMYLQRNWLGHVAPRETKIRAIAAILHMRLESVVESLNWLVAKNYLIEHKRGFRGTRRFTLAWSRPAPPQAQPA